MNTSAFISLNDHDNARFDALKSTKCNIKQGTIFPTIRNQITTHTIIPVPAQDALIG